MTILLKARQHNSVMLNQYMKPHKDIPSLSHDEMLIAFTKWITNKGFVVVSEEMAGIRLTQSYIRVGEPDLLLTTYDNLVNAVRLNHFGLNDLLIAIEIKPAYATPSEVVKGIGQCASYLSTDMVPFLVIDAKHEQWVGHILNKIKLVNLITFNCSLRTDPKFRYIYDINADSNYHTKLFRLLK